jgi:hypothetical protein
MGAEGHEHARFGQGNRLGHGGAEGIGVAHLMVRRHDQQQGVGFGQQGGHGHGGGGVAAHGLDDDGARFQADFAQLLGHDEAVFLIAHHHGPAGNARGGVLQQGGVRSQRQQLLGAQFPRQRPQTGAGAAGQDDGDDLSHGRPRDYWMRGRRPPPANHRPE